ncbi:hypothetical protein VNO80_22684 [Phaseolus coccineus]|uniref:Uncharacterized protein n=1 Tax=Phaseolus coccineus TaxID=3886 RepID=A0AAN9M4L0_PHACN
MCTLPPSSSFSFQPAQAPISSSYVHLTIYLAPIIASSYLVHSIMQQKFCIKLAHPFQEKKKSAAITLLAPAASFILTSYTCTSALADLGASNCVIPALTLQSTLHQKLDTTLLLVKPVLHSWQATIPSNSTCRLHFTASSSINKIKITRSD